MPLCAMRSITQFSRRIYCDKLTRLDESHAAESGNVAGLCKDKKEGNVMSKLLGVIAIATVAFAVAPAEAAKHAAGGCSGTNLEKTETAIENMADGDSKFVAQKEIAAAQDALLNGKMGVCGAHLNKAMQASMAK
ncbi:hypothetical protein [Bradyrhizobium sp. CCBAU 51765]|uniref:hypothetical protein n=1 Tax=Bradyrhizobium sp. CCBAU 51765 TaxID=1325102 RepID=UPI001FEFECF0|nr:hypothetical protein [Bradyrhizobium sp. CCBAU 51765]